MTCTVLVCRISSNLYPCLLSRTQGHLQHDVHPAVADHPVPAADHLPRLLHRLGNLRRLHGQEGLLQQRHKHHRRRRPLLLRQAGTLR